MHPAEQEDSGVLGKVFPSRQIPAHAHNKPAPNGLLDNPRVQAKQTTTTRLKLVGLRAALVIPLLILPTLGRTRTPITQLAVAILTPSAQIRPPTSLRPMTDRPALTRPSANAQPNVDERKQERPRLLASNNSSNNSMFRMRLFNRNRPRLRLLA